MVRKYIQTTDRCLMSKDVMQRAVNEVINENKSIRSVAEAHRIKSPMTLCCYVKKAREQGLEKFQFGYNNKRQIFSDPQELFVLRFYGPVNPMGSCRARSVYLTTRLLGRLNPLYG